MNTFSLIGLTGSVLDKNGNHICIANSGKSSSAKVIKQSLIEKGLEVKIVSLASALVSLAVTATGLSGEHFTSQKLKNTPMRLLGGSTPRDIMIQRGKEVRSKYGQMALTRILEMNHKDFKGVIIVDDIRNNDEANWVRNNGALVKVARKVNLSGIEFLNSIGINSIDSSTESDVKLNNGDSIVSLGGLKKGFKLTHRLNKNSVLEAA